MFQTFIARVLMALVVFGAGFSFVAFSGTESARAQEKKKDKKEKDPLEGKKGTTIGTLTDKGTNFIEVKAAGEEKGRRYVPQWVGGLPAKGGGPDKKIVKLISGLKVGSRVEVQWVFEERLRVLGVKVLKAPANKDK